MGKYKKYIKSYTIYDLVTKTMILFKILLGRNFMNHQIAILETIENCSMNHPETCLNILNSKNMARNFVKDLEEEIR